MLFFLSLVALVLCVSATAAPQAVYDPGTKIVTVKNGRIELRVETASGLNPNSLRDTKSGRSYADRDYTWPGGALPTMIGVPSIAAETDGSKKVVFVATMDGLRIQQTFAAPAAEPGTITETIRIENPGTTTLDTSTFACGFGKTISDANGWLADVADSRFCNVPYRRWTETGELADYTVPELTTKTSRFATIRNDWYGWTNSDTWGAEAWAWYKGGNVLLVAKYNNDCMEWSLVKPSPSGAGKMLRFGGAGRWKLGDPERAASLAAGAGFTFGITRYSAMDGDWRQGYAAFRAFTESKGHTYPANYNPPIHWNELYDNQAWWSGDSVANRNLHYKRSDMQIEAEKAVEIGCECLYLDPGWDTIFGSTIWDSARLGTQWSFVDMLKTTYGGLSLALHCPLAPWTDGSTYDCECLASKQYRDTKVARLIQNCADGAYFLMFDGSWFETCSHPDHGHPVPLTRQDHVDAILDISKRVHAAYPNVVIEQHDPITGPGTPRYTPTYFMHAKPGAFDELWGFEYMILGMDDILTKRAYSLYYYNLAYSIPVYLHIDLRRDNDQAILFWWYASTCRHLGIGGKSTDASIWNAQKAAMATYKANKRFFTQGTFYGLDETIHAHTLTDLNESLINCFNVTTSAVTREIRLKLLDVGLKQGAIQVENAGCALDGDEVVLTVSIPALGHAQVRLKAVNTDH